MKLLCLVQSLVCGLCFFYGLTLNIWAAVPVWPRVVSASTTSDEILWYLLDHKDGESLNQIMFSSLADDPRYSNVASQIRQFKKGLVKQFRDLEQLISFNPQIVFLSPYNDASFEAHLKSRHYKIIKLRPTHNWEDLWLNISSMGRAVNRAQEAEKLIKRLKTQLAVIKQSCRRSQGESWQQQREALVFSSNFVFPLADTMVTFLLEQAGYENLALKVLNQKGWHKISAEQFVRLKPRYLIVPDSKNEMIIKAQQLDPLWQRLWNQKNISKVYVPGSLLFSTSPYSVDALKLLCH